MITVTNGKIEISNNSVICANNSIIKVHAISKDHVPYLLECNNSRLIINGIDIGEFNTNGAKNIIDLVNFLLDKCKNRKPAVRYTYVRYIMSYIRKFKS